MSPQKFRHAARVSLALAGALCLATAARADEAEELFQAGLRAEQSMDFAAAAGAYARSLELRPSASFAQRARIRLDDLRGHADGGYGPLARLEAVRRSRQLSSDPAALGALLADARAFPVGRVKAEALLLVAEAFARRLDDPARAIPAAQLLVDEPAFDRPLRSRGLDLLAGSYLALGQPAQARAAVAAHPGLAPELERQLLASDRRGRYLRGAQGTVGALLLVVAASLARLRGAALAAWRPLLLAPTSLAVCAAISLGGVALTHLFDESLSLRPFALLGPSIFLVDRSIALARRAFGARPWARALLALLGAAAVAAFAFLALYLSDPSFLASFGL